MERNDPSDRPCDFGLLVSANRLPNWHLKGDDLAEDATKKAVLVAKEKKLLREMIFWSALSAPQKDLKDPLVFPAC